MASRRKPRICFLVGGREGGGMAVCTQRFVDGIDRARFDVTVVACEDGSFTRRLVEANNSCTLLNTGWPPQLSENVASGSRMRVLAIPHAAWWVMHTTVSLARHLRRGRIDIVHTNYTTYHFVAAMACLLGRGRCVWHWHAIVGGGWGRRACRLLHAFAPRKNHSIANSRATFDSVSAITPRRTSLVYNGIPIGARSTDRGVLHRRAGLATDARVVGMVGTLNPIKGHRNFIEAAAELCPRHEDVRFVYIGGHTAAGQQDYLASLEAMCEAAGLADRVLFLGHQPDAAELMADFDVGVVCTLPPGEGFGMVIVEAMAQGVPVIATNVGAAPELLQNGETGLLIPPADGPALARAIESLLTDDAKRRAMGAAAQRACHERFDIAHTIRGVEEVYEALIDNRARVRRQDCPCRSE